MPFDINKPVQTRDGRKARVVCTDKTGLSGPVVVLVQEGSTASGEPNESIYTYHPNGRAARFEDPGLALINILQPTPPPAAFDPAKPVQTRDGRPARIICTDMDSPSGATIAALVRWSDGKERAYGYRPDGTAVPNAREWAGRQDDLVNSPEEHTVWINLYKSSIGKVYAGSATKSLEEANYSARGSGNRIACVPVTFKEGDGL